MSESKVEELVRKVKTKTFSFKIGGKRWIAHAEAFLTEIEDGITPSQLASRLKYTIELTHKVLEFLKGENIIEYEGELNPDTKIKLTEVGRKVKEKIVEEKRKTVETFAEALGAGFFEEG